MALDDGSRSAGGSSALTVYEPTVTLREFIVIQIHALDVRYEERHQAQNKLLDQRALNQEQNVRTALDSLKLRLDAMNEFRDQIREERANYVTRNEFEAWKTSSMARADRDEKATDDRLKLLENSRSNMDGKMVVLVVVVGFVINFAMRYIK